MDYPDVNWAMRYANDPIFRRQREIEGVEALSRRDELSGPDRRDLRTITNLDRESMLIDRIAKGKDTLLSQSREDKVNYLISLAADEDKPFLHTLFSALPEQLLDGFVVSKLDSTVDGNISNSFTSSAMILNFKGATREEIITAMGNQGYDNKQATMLADNIIDLIPIMEKVRFGALTINPSELRPDQAVAWTILHELGHTTDVVVDSDEYRVLQSIKRHMFDRISEIDAMTEAEADALGVEFRNLWGAVKNWTDNMRARTITEAEEMTGPLNYDEFSADYNGFLLSLLAISNENTAQVDAETSDLLNLFLKHDDYFTQSYNDANKKGTITSIMQSIKNALKSLIGSVVKLLNKSPFLNITLPGV